MPYSLRAISVKAKQLASPLKRRKRFRIRRDGRKLKFTLKLKSKGQRPLIKIVERLLKFTLSMKRRGGAPPI